MRHRIRVSALAVRDNGILLVRHVVGDQAWWCPPGGGADRDEPLLACAERELTEETGLTAIGRRIVYLLDYIVDDPPCRNLEVYVLMGEPAGLPDVPANESRYLKEARFFQRHDLVGETVYPAVLRDEFWVDLAAGFHETRYLGVSRAEA